MLSLGGVVGPSGWWSVFIMCVWESWHDGALGHWHGNSLAITPAAPRSDWRSYMGHRRSHRYGWKVGFCSFSSPLFLFPPLWVSWRKGRKEAQHVAAPRANVLPLCVLLFLSLFLSHLSCLPSCSLLSLIALSALWSVSKLPFSLSVWFPHFLFISPDISSSSKKTQWMHFRNSFFFFFFFLKADCFAQTQFKPDCPQCCLLLKLPALWIPSVWRECPLHFFYTVTQVRSHTLAFTHMHKHTGILGLCRDMLTIAHAQTHTPPHSHTDLHQNIHTHAHTYIKFQQCHWYREWISLPLWTPSFHLSPPGYTYMHGLPPATGHSLSKSLIQVKLLTCILYTPQLSFLVAASNKAVKR